MVVFIFFIKTKKVKMSFSPSYPVSCQEDEGRQGAVARVRQSSCFPCMHWNNT